jgi:maltoporin
VLQPLDASTTRLLTRMRVTYRPTAKWGPYVHLLLEPGHFVMGRRQLLGVRQRAEATSDAA